jgi:hypothetical protein
MRGPGFIMWIVIAAGVFAAARIRGEEPALSLFAIPKVELRKEQVSGVEMEEAEIKEEGGSEKEELSVTTGRADVVSEISIQVYESMNGESVLGRMEMPDEPGGAIGWLQSEVWDPVFAPEVVKLGKVQLSGGVVAGIKRKNPFCLLHPLVFVASW